MKKNDLEKRVERLEKDSHPPVAWKEKIENLVKRIDHLYKIYGEMISNIMKQRK